MLVFELVFVWCVSAGVTEISVVFSTASFEVGQVSLFFVILFLGPW